MTQKNPPGYPLPDGELGEDEIVCQLIYLPNRPEYWQALLAGIHYFSTWRAWERDADKRGQDAAANWRVAFELTMECWRMTCLEDLTTTVTDILELLQTKKDCCDDNVSYLPTEEVETEIDPGVGDPPENYGETPVEDWDEWSQYLCYSAHKYVDYLAHTGSEMFFLMEVGTISLGVAAAFLTLLAASGVGLPIAFGTAAAIVGGISLLGTITTFLNSADSIEAARDDIVCAIMQNGDLAGAVEAALSSGLDWDVWYSWVPYDTALAIMYEGGHDGEFLAAEVSEDCDVCDYTQLTEDDLHIGWIYGESLSYDEDIDEWTVLGQQVSGCRHVYFIIWEDDSETVPKQCKMRITSCDGDLGGCGGAESDRGWGGGPLHYDYSHPPLVNLDHEAIDTYRHVHAIPGVHYTLTFKLYE